MEDQFGMPTNLHQYMNTPPVFTSVQPPPDIISNHRSLAAAQHFDTMVMMSHRPNELLSHGLHSDSTTTNTGVSAGRGGGGGSGGFSGIDGGGFGGDGGSGRWPRQETLTLLEIRSRLDTKFKEVNQKGPLWDEVSRIMYEEHGYQRSGKKCREKFENLYKYYKKTKEGKAGRQDGKHYRFFRQLEALYGETTTTATTNYPPTSISANHLAGSTSFRHNNSTNNQEFISQDHASKPYEENSLGLSNSSDFETTSSEDSNPNHNNENSSSVGKRKKRSKKGWKTKIKEFIDAQMRKLMVKQESWLDKMMKTIEHKEQERMMREETWKKQEEERIEKEHKFWDKEKAWIEARDIALMEALHKLTGKESVPNDNASETITNLAIGESSWQECEITRLIQLRSGMEPRLFFQEVGCGEMIWEEISAKMASFGYDRSPLVCKNKWESINDYLIKYQRRGKESSSSCGGYFQGNDHTISHHHHQIVGGGGGGGGSNCDNNNETQPTTSSSRGGINDHGGGNSPPIICSTGLNNNVNDNCFRYFMGGDAENNLWENYGVKLCKDENNNH